MIFIEELPGNEALPPMCHSATLCELSSGELLAVWYAGSYEGAVDTMLVASRRLLQGGEAWSEPECLLVMPGLPVGNPVLHAEHDHVTLYFVILYGTWWTEAKVACIESKDHGYTWSRPELLRPESGLMLRTPPVRLSSGTLLLPMYNEQTWSPLVLRREVDEKSAWQLRGDTTARGKAIQPALAELSDGSILMYSRSNQGRIYESWSFNDGKSWTASQPTALPNPNSGVALVATVADTLVLVYNPDERGREHLGVSISEDAGRTWTPPRLLASGRGEYSYPTLLRSHRGEFHLVYTRHRASILYAAFDLAWAKHNNELF
jgi:predicted neuraminidase